MAAVLGTINGASTRIHLDSCSEISCISRNYFDSLNIATIKPSVLIIQGANGSSLQCDGSVEIVVTLGNISWLDSYAVIPDLGVDVLIGQPAMRTHRIDIINSRHVVQITDAEGLVNEIPFPDINPVQNTEPTARMHAVVKSQRTIQGYLYSDAEVTIPARTELSIPVFVPKTDGDNKIMFTAFIDNLASAKVFYVAKGIQEVPFGTAQVVICNPSSVPCKIGQSQKVATYTAIDMADYNVLDINETMHPSRVLMLAKQVLDELGADEDEFKDFPLDLNI